MEEPYDEGIANHIGPESCASGGNVMGEALTGVHAGWVLSRERPNESGRRRCWLGRKTKSVASLRRDVSRAPRGRRPQARMETPRARTGRSHLPALQESLFLSGRANQLEVGIFRGKKLEERFSGILRDGSKVRAVNPKGNTTAMHGYGKSDNLIVPQTFSNKVLVATITAERSEGRRLAKGNSRRSNKYRTQYRVRSGYGEP